MVADFTFPQRERLKDSRQIREVFASRKRYSTPGMRLIVEANELAHNRVLFAPTRGYGNAVQRNRTKRIGREIYRHIRSRLSAGHDLAFVLYAGVDTFVAREEQVMALCRKAGILRPTGE